MAKKKVAAAQKVETAAPEIKKDDEAEETTKLTPLEKLDAMCEATPVRIFQVLIAFTHQGKWFYAFKYENNKADDDGTGEKDYNITVRFGKVTAMIKNCKISRIDARSIILDMLLKKLYGDEHENMVEHNDYEAVFGEDAEGWATNLEKLKEMNKRWINGRVKKMKATDEEKAEKIKDLTEKNEPTDTLPAYDDIIEHIENCYWSPLEGTCHANAIKSELVYTKIKNGTEETFELGNRDNSDPADDDTQYKVRIDISKKGMEPLAYEAEGPTVREARSAVSYNCLKQLLEDGTVTTIVHTKKAAVKQNALKKKQNIEKARKQTQNNAKAMQNMSGPMMMMPCVIGPNGQYMVCMPGNMNVGGQAKKPGKKGPPQKGDKPAIVRPPGQGQSASSVRKRKLKEAAAAKAAKVAKES